MENNLENLELFKGIVSADLKAMLSCIGGHIKSYDKGDIISMENDTIKNVGIILKGTVQMIKEDIWGNRAIIVVMKRGDLIGEIFACGQLSTANASYLASQKTQLLILPFHRVLTTCNNSCPFHHKLIENMVVMIAGKSRQLMEKIEVTSQKTLRDKILAYLSLQSQKAKSLNFEIPLGRTDLADYLCADRSALTRELNSMRDDGLINFDKNRFCILKKE